MTDDDDRRFAVLFQRFLERSATLAQQYDQTLTALGEAVSAHLGVDASTLSVVEESIANHRVADLAVALEALDPGAQVIGVSGGQHKLFNRFVDMLTQMGVSFAPAQVDYAVAETGPASTRTVVAFGVRFMHLDGEPLAILQRTADPQRGVDSARIEVLARTPDIATNAIARITGEMDARSTLRGHVLTIGMGAAGFGQATAQFRPRPGVPADAIVLPDGTLERIRRHVLGVREHADTLRAQGAHLKRGVLLYGPPGTGKTLTVSHLVGAAEGVTCILLTGPSIAYVSEAAALARSLQPSMVVLEDVDLIAHDRDMHTGGSQPLLFAVLDALEGLDGDADIAFVLTTNRVDVLEEALAQRPGRVDLAVELPRPTAAERQVLFALAAQSAPFSEAAIRAAAERADGVTGSFAKELVRRALLTAAAQARPATDDDLELALFAMLSEAEALSASMLGGRGTPPGFDIELSSQYP
ncbi:MAG: AAA family ATPase [Microcella sp.]